MDAVKGVFIFDDDRDDIAEVRQPAIVFEEGRQIFYNEFDVVVTELVNRGYRVYKRAGEEHGADVVVGLRPGADGGEELFAFLCHCSIDQVKCKNKGLLLFNPSNEGLK